MSVRWSDPESTSHTPLAHTPPPCLWPHWTHMLPDWTPHTYTTLHNCWLNWTSYVCNTFHSIYLSRLVLFMYKLYRLLHLIHHTITCTELLMISYWMYQLFQLSMLLYWIHHTLLTILISTLLYCIYYESMLYYTEFTTLLNILNSINYTKLYTKCYSSANSIILISTLILYPLYPNYNEIYTILY